MLTYALYLCWFLLYKLEKWKVFFICSFYVLVVVDCIFALLEITCEQIYAINYDADKHGLIDRVDLLELYGEAFSFMSTGYILMFQVGLMIELSFEVKRAAEEMTQEQLESKKRTLRVVLGVAFVIYSASSIYILIIFVKKMSNHLTRDDLGNFERVILETLPSALILSMCLALALACVRLLYSM